MLPAYVLDTHALIWFLEGNPRLSDAARAICEGIETTLYIPSISILEACNMIERNRSSITRQELFHAMNGDARIELPPLDAECAMIASDLIDLPDIHDRIIVATALQLRRERDNVQLVSCDKKIRESKLITTIWD